MGTVSAKHRKQLDADLAAWKSQLDDKHQGMSLPLRVQEGAHKRVQVAKAVVERRESQLAKVAHPGRREALRLALSVVGTTESPAGSNTGPRVDVWERHFGIHAQPWCGAFVGFMIEKAGGNVTPRIVYTPYIFEDALHGHNGLDSVVWHDGFSGQHIAHTFDLVLFDFGTAGGIKHVAALAQPWKGVGPLQTVEGNTSFGGGGSQDNGGAVARRQRDISLVHSIVSARW